MKSGEGDPLLSGEKKRLIRSIKREGWAMRGAAVMKGEVVWSDGDGLREENRSWGSNFNAEGEETIEEKGMTGGTSRHSKNTSTLEDRSV
jgi:hypothetical protein